MTRIKASELSQENKALIEIFIVKCQIQGLAKGTLVGYLNYITRMAQRVQELGINKPLDAITEADFNLLLVTLQNEHNLEQSSLRNFITRSRRSSLMSSRLASLLDGFRGFNLRQLTSCPTI